MLVNDWLGRYLCELLGYKRYYFFNFHLGIEVKTDHLSEHLHYVLTILGLHCLAWNCVFELRLYHYFQVLGEIQLWVIHDVLNQAMELLEFRFAVKSLNEILDFVLHHLFSLQMTIQKVEDEHGSVWWKAFRELILFSKQALLKVMESLQNFEQITALDCFFPRLGFVSKQSFENNGLVLVNVVYVNDSVAQLPVFWDVLTVVQVNYNSFFVAFR